MSLSLEGDGNGTDYFEKKLILLKKHLNVQVTVTVTVTLKVMVTVTDYFVFFKVALLPLPSPSLLPSPLHLNAFFKRISCFFQSSPLPLPLPSPSLLPSPLHLDCKRPCHPEGWQTEGRGNICSPSSRITFRYFRLKSWLSLFLSK